MKKTKPAATPHVHAQCNAPAMLLDYGGNLRCLAPVIVAFTELEVCQCGAYRFTDVLNEHVQPGDWGDADALSEHMLDSWGVAKVAVGS